MEKHDRKGYYAGKGVLALRQKMGGDSHGGRSLQFEYHTSTAPLEDVERFRGLHNVQNWGDVNGRSLKPAQSILRQLDGQSNQEIVNKINRMLRE